MKSSLLLRVKKVSLKKSEFHSNKSEILPISLFQEWKKNHSLRVNFSLLESDYSNQSFSSEQVQISANIKEVTQERVVWVITL